MKTTLNGLLYDLVLEAGEIASTEQERARPQLKDDDSYVTDVDIRLSDLCIRKLSAVLPEENIITEESLHHLYGVRNRPLTGEDEILAVIDPLDGTRNYVHNMPLYGISLGILKNRVPWLGYVMFPALDELFYCDGDRSYFEREVLHGERRTVELTPPESSLSSNTTVLCSDEFMRSYRWDYDAFQLLQTGCATVNLCWPMIGRGVASIFGAHPWDLVGSWPIIASLGYRIIGMQSGREISLYEPTDYTPDTHGTGEMWLVTQPEHFRLLSAAATPIA
jgi:myo-inositol-1(or 4)-monophosphatase